MQKLHIREVWRSVQTASGERHLTLFAEVVVCRHGRRWNTKWSIEKWGRAEAFRRAEASGRAYLAQADRVQPRRRRKPPLGYARCSECGARFPTRRPSLARTCSGTCRSERHAKAHAL